MKFSDRYVPNLLKSLRTQKIVYICCGEDHTAALTKVLYSCKTFFINIYGSYFVISEYLNNMYIETLRVIDV